MAISLESQKSFIVSLYPCMPARVAVPALSTQNGRFQNSQGEVYL